MVPIALALTLAGAAPPPTPFSLEPRPGRACAVEIDPQFVRYVDPPAHRDGRNPLLWLVSGEGRAVSPGADCLRPLQVRDRR